MADDTYNNRVGTNGADDIDEKKQGHILDRTESRQLSDILPEGAVDPVYQAKAEVLNRAIQEIGFGRYQGWRYFVITMGGLMLVLWGIRFFVFHLHESPKYLMGRGRDAEAVEVVHKVAAYNGKTIDLTVEDLTRFDREVDPTEGNKGLDTSAKAAVQRNVEKFSSNHIKALFKTRKLAISTSLIILIWAIIGLAFPLYNAFVPYYLATRGADFGDGSVYITYRNQVILSVLGIPGAL
ncbi:hypothetical protein FRC00_007734, partial [Tulasnella sp. 408]